MRRSGCRVGAGLIRTDVADHDGHLCGCGVCREVRNDNQNGCSKRFHGYRLIKSAGQVGAWQVTGTETSRPIRRLDHHAPRVVHSGLEILDHDGHLAGSIRGSIRRALDFKQPNLIRAEGGRP